MSDTLDIFGKRYNNVTGIIATNSDGTELTFTRGGGSSKNVQAYLGYDSVNTASYTATDVTLTVAKTGTYKISWMGWKNTSRTDNASQLYVNGVAIGSEAASFLNTYGLYVELTNQSLNEGDVIEVRARSRGSSYYMSVGNLIIEEV